jgi:hypothetical protein
MAAAGACLGGIYGLYLGMSNWGILAALILGIIGIIAGGVIEQSCVPSPAETLSHSRNAPALFRVELLAGKKVPGTYRRLRLRRSRNTT